MAIAMDLAVAQDVFADRYRLIQQVGQGGMAQVFLADDLRNGRKVAIKVLDPELSQALGARRFLQEIQTAANLTHTNILPLHDSGEAGGFLYYVMPFVEGESLRSRMDREGPLPIDETIRIACEVADALAYAHRKGVLHRDVKPANILLEAGHAVLADFGVAQAIGRQGPPRPALTEPGVALGTPGYMSPEQASGSGVLDGRSDQYSLACVLHEMLAGEPLFSGPSSPAIIARHLTERPMPVRLARPSVPRAVEDVLLRALEKRPADRFPSVADLAQALEFGHRASWKRYLWAFSVPRTRWKAWAGTLFGFAFLGGLLAILLTPPPPPEWAETWPESLVVLPFVSASSSEDEHQLTLEVAEQVAEDLDWWDEIRALGRASLSGVMHDLGVTESAFRSSRDAIRVAKAAEVQALLGVTVRTQRDSVFLQATLFEASNGKLVGGPVLARGRVGEVQGMVASINLDLLRLAREAPNPRHHGTRSLAAFREFLAGGNALSRSELDSAEANFRRAIESDGAYGPARTWLALSLYWQAIEGVRSLSAIRSEITEQSTRAMEALGRLAGADSLHVVAFFAFQQGSYEQSRRVYRQLVESKADDLFAWLMLGTIETNDYWMVPGPDGEARPRSNLNQALIAFDTVSAIRPTFELGYLQRFQVSERLEEAARTRSCPLFGALRAELIPPGQGPGTRGARAYCPVLTDSIQWLPMDRFSDMDRASVQSGVDRLFDQSVRMLDAWERFAPTSARPRELKAEALVRRHDGMGISSPDRVRSLAAQALRHAEAALGLRRDTAPEALLRIANLRLAAGFADSAVELAEEALRRIANQPDSLRSPPPRSAANVFLAAGRIEAAVEIARSSPTSRLVLDPETQERVPYAGAESVVEAIKILGAGGVEGSPLHRELSKLDSLWRAAQYTPRQTQLLRNSISQRIGAALVQDEEALAEWAESVDVDREIWATLGVSPRTAVDDRAFHEAIKASSDRTDRAERIFLLAWNARMTGEATRAVQTFSRLDSIPRRVGALDMGWGLRTISLIYRAEALEALGRGGEAMSHMDGFLRAWPDPDTLGQRVMDRTRRERERIGGRAGG